ncbi:UDP-glycosyltransferase 87A2 [Linum grandiflorum]
MNTAIPSPEEIRRRHVVAVPYPGRGHINPMLNVCNLLSSKNPHLLITVVVTEEWLGFLSAAGSIFTTTHNGNIQLASIPNVIPSELVRGSDFPAFYTAVMTEMETPVDELLNQISIPPITALISDTELRWAIRVGNQRKIPVATLCTVPAEVFSAFHRFSAIQDLQLRDSVLDEEGMDCHSSTHGISPPEIADLKAIFRGDDRRIMGLTLECISWVPKAQYLLVNSVEELEHEAFNVLKSELKLPIYPIGPAIPFYQLNHNNTNTSESALAYFNWLESQPKGSVLYVSLGSFLSISSKQMDELAEGLIASSVRFLWVARGETKRVQERCGEKGMVVPWCDQMKVLNHCSLGGFLTHCGWNSTLEAIYCGVPMLTFPLIFDQVPNSRRIVENWKVGWRLKRDVMGIEEDELVRREEICDVVKRFMDGEESEVKEMRKRGKELREVCRGAIAEGGSSDKNLDAFIKEISAAS